MNHWITLNARSGAHLGLDELSTNLLPFSYSRLGLHGCKSKFQPTVTVFFFFFFLMKLDLFNSKVVQHHHWRCS